MRKLFYLFILVTLLAACASGGNNTVAPAPAKQAAPKAPVWFTNPPANNQQYVYGTGQSTSQQAALAAARNDLASYFGAVIKGSLTIDSSLSQTNTQTSTQTNMHQVNSLRVGTDFPGLSTIERQQIDGLWYVLVQIDLQQARARNQQIITTIERLLFPGALPTRNLLSLLHAKALTGQLYFNQQIHGVSAGLYVQQKIDEFLQDMQVKAEPVYNKEEAPTGWKVALHWQQLKLAKLPLQCLGQNIITDSEGCFDIPYTPNSAGTTVPLYVWLGQDLLNQVIQVRPTKDTATLPVDPIVITSVTLPQPKVKTPVRIALVFTNERPHGIESNITSRFASILTQKGYRVSNTAALELRLEINCYHSSTMGKMQVYKAEGSASLGHNQNWLNSYTYTGVDIQEQTKTFDANAAQARNVAVQKLVELIATDLTNQLPSY